MHYVCFATTAAHKTISSNEQQSPPSKTGIHKEIDGAISAVLSLTPGTAFCYNNLQHLWSYILAGSIQFVCKKLDMRGFVLFPKR